MDIGAIIKAPLDDGDWIKKMLLQSLWGLLVCLIPIAGAIIASLNGLGWMKRYYDERVRGGTKLPEPSAFGYLSDGWQFFLSMLPIAAVFIAFGIVAGILVAIMSAISDTLGGLVGVVVGLAGFALGLVVLVVSPAMVYNYLSRGTAWAGMKIGDAIAIAKANTGAYVMLIVTILLAGIIQNAGSILCGVGLLITIPFSAAMTAAAYAEFKKVTNI